MKLEAPELQSDGLSHGFFTREGGVSSGLYDSLNIGLGSDDDRDLVLENRSRVARTFGVARDHLVSPYQIHSPDVLTVDGPWLDDQSRKADALVTATPNLALGISTADCGPVLFADPEASVIGAAHSGWKGAISGVLQNTVAAMENLGAQRGRIRAVLGPTISQASYEVGPEFHDRFLSESSSWAQYFIPSSQDGFHMFNLPAFITDRLTGLGLAHVNAMNICTYKDEARFFSYRRTTHRKEPDYGRQVSAIMIKG
ncbi:peptidoglycan editing factor PgeF [Labrenzia sp. PHM005]|uniref:peptidoglycan editing factor PgeF n=1 Tax=Labrenzia sp. PHM005 TaxID=2590016 RepID=UPI001140059C|nr:peptidoglycan editing factor PgeF [Labrenzia sp. PHM005]QDG76475.1 peptidoglycan editing factor PgeF [Labrenzia sp. PHM005]